MIRKFGLSLYLNGSTPVHLSELPPQLADRTASELAAGGWQRMSVPTEVAGPWRVFWRGAGRHGETAVMYAYDRESLLTV